MALSSAPFDQWYLAYIAYVPLFIITKNLHAQKQGLAFALTSTVIVANWWHSTIIVTFIFFILILFILGFSFYLWAVLSAQFRTKTSNPFYSIFMPAVIWVGLERILSSEWIGIPCNIGITQTSQPLLIQSASLFGIYTTSFLIVLTNTTLATIIPHLIRKKALSKQQNFTVGLAFLFMLMNIGYGYHALSQQKEVKSLISIAMIQPIISSKLYNDSLINPESRKSIGNILTKLTEKALKEKPDILVWPEGGNGYLNMRNKKLRNRIYKYAEQNKTNLFISSYDIDENGNKYNTLFSISNRGELLGRYDKVLLIPGVEDSYTAGKEFHTISSSYGKVGPSICYESNFPSPLRKLSAQGAELLITSTSDAYFKRTSLTINHTRTAIFRAIENNRWVVHTSNTGPSVIVSPHGIINTSTEFYERGFKIGTVSYIKEKSFFTNYGYLVPIIFALIVLFMISIAGYNSFTQRNLIKKKILHNKIYIFNLTIRSIPFSLIYFLIISLLIYNSIVKVYGMTPVKNIINKDIIAFYAIKEFFESSDTSILKNSELEFLQASNPSYGAAALSYIFSYFGHEIHESNLIAQMSVSTKGPSMSKIKETILNNGLQVNILKKSYNDLINEQFPIIAYINNLHYVIINKASSNKIYIFDPLLGHIEVSRQTFQKKWDGNLLLIRTKEIKKSFEI